MSTGSMRSVVEPSSPGGRVVSVMVCQPYSSVDAALNVKEADVSRVTCDEAAPCLDVLAHQDREQFVGRGGVVEGDAAQHPGTRIHGGLPQLLGIHFAEALVPLDAVFCVDPSARSLAGLEQSVALAVRVRELGFAALPLQ